MSTAHIAEGVINGLLGGSMLGIIVRGTIENTCLNGVTAESAPIAYTLLNPPYCSGIVGDGLFGAAFGGFVGSQLPSQDKKD